MLVACRADGVLPKNVIPLGLSRGEGRGQREENLPRPADVTRAGAL